MNNCFDLYKRKVNYRLGTSEQDMKQKGFEELLASNSYGVEEVQKIEGKEVIIAETKCFIRDHKLHLDYDEKYLFTPLAIATNVGDVFYWPRTNTHWIVYAQFLTEKSYYKSVIKRANWCINWRNSFGKLEQQWAYVKGPVETKLKSNTVKSKIVGTHNWTLSMLLPDNDKTKDLKQYGYIMLNGKKWEITVADDITTQGIVELQLSQVSADDIDDKENNIVEGKLIPEYEFEYLVELLRIPLEYEFDINEQVILTCNGIVWENDFSIEKLSGSAIVDGTKVYFPELGESELRIYHNQNPEIESTIVVKAIRTVHKPVDNKIYGPSSVKSLLEYQYSTQVASIKDTYKWKIWDEKKIIASYKEGNEKIDIKFGGKTGKVTLNLYVNDVLADSMNIKVEGLFE